VISNLDAIIELAEILVIMLILSLHLSLSFLFFFRRTHVQQGFEVSLEIKEDRGQSLIEIEGKLPANKDIENLYQSWLQSFYRVTGIYRNDESWDIDESIATNIASSDLVRDCWQKVQNLEANMRSWLQPSADINWQKIREKLAQELARHSQEIRLIIKARKKEVWKLPWHVWDLLLDYPDVGIGYSTNEHQPPPLRQTTHNKVRILAVFGDNKNIDLTEDLQAINNLKNTEPVFLHQPNSRELIQKLRSRRGWDIFFFAGHSQTEINAGRIYLNERESLTIDRFKNALTEAINQGLQIAIFNSCDGLKLAQRLADLHIPVVIVMQEIVPDRVAQSFLKEFLTEYNCGQPLYTAVRRAQARLEEFIDYPGATWLPLIFQNPTVIPPKWNDFLSATSDKLPPQSSQVVPFKRAKSQWYRLLQVVLNSLAIASLAIGVRWLGILQPWELWAYDRLMQLRPGEGQPDPRLLVVTVDNSDIKYQEQKGMKNKSSLESLSDEALNKLLKEIEKLNPTTIGLDIYRPDGFDPALSIRLQEDERFFAICKAFSVENDEDFYGTPPPQEIPKQQLGFSDVLLDRDKVVRRHLLSMMSEPTDPCNTEYSLSSLLALHYLSKQKDIAAKLTSEGEWQLKNLILKRLNNHSSGYQKLDDRGYQILLNYRFYSSPKTVTNSISLQKVLEEGIPSTLVKRVQQPIVFIGTIARGENYDDFFDTPYGEEIPGVFLQAQMVSQIISAVLDERPILWWWNGWIEALWIWVWSMVGGILVISIPHRSRLILNLIGSLIGILAICLVIFTHGGWIPLIPPVLALVATTIIVYKIIRN
jgi:CHASE2 domain-containing sensor protein